PSYITYYSLPTRTLYLSFSIPPMLLILHHPLSFTAPAPTATSPLSLHDALPIYLGAGRRDADDDTHAPAAMAGFQRLAHHRDVADRKSTRLNSSHLGISYAVFCLKKKKKKNTDKL